MAQQMTSRERVFAAVTMTELPDQVPVVPLLMTRGIREGGVRVDEVLLDGEAQAHAKKKSLDKFGGDVIIAGTDLFTPVECVPGCELDYLPYAQPSLVTHPTPTKEAFYRFKEKYEKEGFQPSKRVRAIQDEIRTYVKMGLKDTHAIPTPVGGPITTAQLMTGSSEFLQLLSDDPDYAHEVTKLALDIVKNVCRMMFEAGADVCNILDPFNSSDILPPEVYREHGLPYQKELFRYINEDLKGIGFTHTCTFTQPIWRDIAGNGCLNFNGDMYPGMDKCKQAIGGQISLMGTLSPYSTLMHGSTDAVRNEVKKLAAEVGYNGGFICMPGCDIDWNIPEENMHAMIQQCAEIKYPMDVAALGDLSEVYLPGHPKHPGKRSSSAEEDQSVTKLKSRSEDLSPVEEVNQKLVEAIMEYDGEKAIEWTKKGLERGMTAQDIVFDGLSLGMKIVGDMYERNERFVTDMLKAAKTMDKAMPVLTPLLEAAGDGDGPTGTVVVGLVRGNTQDIGKNLVCLMLKANGFNVIDLGKNVKPEQFVETAEKENAIAIGMSVMTNSSSVYVEKTKQLLEEQGKGDKYLLMFGGAAANVGLGRQIGVEYGIDANAAVSLVKDHVAKRATAA
ncbi:MtaA/CmuA family methyltransferase [Celeribacter indicus]|uniref:Methyltransferase/corrinoid binding protein CmuA n=1 Tax=Celeribacter indicus TaxID=1208324 RepID=A0A0B5E5N6_9RHOB|nr:MtaA/CmuA family methyltransferase [Celeribacter indicus]AJE48680.1 methyltransferase/corrinoid binding protein CmuA [Celeribacter indicus]SDX35607.1 CmuA protein precursor [Celeribacter indicus]